MARPLSSSASTTAACSPSRPEISASRSRPAPRWRRFKDRARPGGRTVMPNQKTPETLENARAIPLKSLRVGQLNPRTHFDDDAHKELVASVKEKGIVTPI